MPYKSEQEERYIVLKIKGMSSEQEQSIRDQIKAEGIPTRECVVVEPDWPIYNETWDNVQRLAESQPSIGNERDSLLQTNSFLKGQLQAIRDSWDGRAATLYEAANQAKSIAKEALATHSLDYVDSTLQASWMADALDFFAEDVNKLSGLTTGSVIAQEAIEKATSLRQSAGLYLEDSSSPEGKPAPK